MRPDLRLQGEECSGVLGCAKSGGCLPEEGGHLDGVHAWSTMPPLTLQSLKNLRVAVQMIGRLTIHGLVVLPWWDALTNHVTLAKGIGVAFQ